MLEKKNNKTLNSKKEKLEGDWTNVSVRFLCHQWSQSVRAKCVSFVASRLSPLPTRDDLVRLIHTS